ncbi:MAG: hypothetical protein JWN84_1198 [Nocardioides sp.]|nr:hypothetical protein [Nocardioides sp.]
MTRRVTFVVDSDGWGGAELWVDHHLRRAAEHGVLASLVATAPVAERLGPHVDGTVTAVQLARHTAVGGAAAHAVERAVLEQEPDVVVVNLVDPASNLAALVAAVCVAPTVGVLHLAGISGSDGCEVRPDLATAYSGLELVIGTGRAAAEQALVIGPPRRGAAVVTNGVDVPEDPQGPARSRPLRVGAHARLTAQKGLDVLVEATRALVDEEVRLKVVLGGAGRDEEALREAARGLPVSFVGWVDDHRGFLAGLDLFCLPSRHEALPLSMLEAMSEGLPCLVTDVGDVVAEVGSAVEVVPPGDVDALAAALRRLLADDARRDELGAAARRCAEDRLGADRMVAETFRLVLGVG